MTNRKDDCRHMWGNVLTERKNKVIPVPTARLCLRCGLLKVGTHTIRISKNRLDMGNLPINNASQVTATTLSVTTTALIGNGSSTGVLRIPVGTNRYA